MNLRCCKTVFSTSILVLLDLKFIFVHVNWFFKRLPEVNKNEMEYFPAEIALGEFTLGNGIIREYHTIVSAPIPLGFNREALETSETSHRIPPEYEGGQSNFGDVLKDIVEFLEEGEPTDDGQLPKLYTTSLQTEPVMSVLKQITEGSGNRPNFLFSMYLFNKIELNYAKLNCYNLCTY